MCLCAAHLSRGYPLSLWEKNKIIILKRKYIYIYTFIYEEPKLKLERLREQKITNKRTNTNCKWPKWLGEDTEVHVYVCEYVYMNKVLVELHTRRHDL